MDNQTLRMPCSQVTENLYDYLTGRLSPILKPVIAEHLMSCNSCRAEHDEMKITLGLLDKMPFTKRPVYRLIMQGTAAAIVILAVVSIIKLLPTTESTTRGGATTTAITEDCKKAIEFYNKGTGTPDLKLKEALLKDALAAGCTDNKVLARIHNNLADCYEQQNRLDEALAGYSKAIDLDLQLYTAFLGMGDIYKKRGQKQPAIAQVLSFLRSSHAWSSCHCNACAY